MVAGMLVFISGYSSCSLWNGLPGLKGCLGAFLGGVNKPETK